MLYVPKYSDDDSKYQTLKRKPLSARFKATSAPVDWTCPFIADKRTCGKKSYSRLAACLGG